MSATRISLAGHGPVWLSTALVALALVALPGAGSAQGANPWRPQVSGQPQFAPVEPQTKTLQAPVAGSYAPPNLDERLSGAQAGAQAGALAPAAPVAPLQAPAERSAGALTPPSATVTPGTGAVVPPYAGLPLANGYGNYGYVPNTTIIVPYNGGYGYPGYGYGGYGAPGYGGSYGAPGYGGYGVPGWGSNGWNQNNNGWNSWSPNGFGFPMGGFSPFGFW